MPGDPARSDEPLQVPTVGPRPLHHVGYWVDSLDTAVADALQLGLGPFLVHAHIAFDTFDVPGRPVGLGPVVFDHSAAFAAWGPVVVEYGEVHAIDPELADAYGVAPGAVSHVSWVVDDLDRECDLLAPMGCRVINTATTGPISVAWLSGGRLFPHPIELHRASPAILGMHDRLVGLSSGWDGTEPMRPMR
ncbi:MAG TPA: VOC family protein [Actinomycetes bacterium]|nr:VOC family protein [Actinomycetes bacterium]